MSPVRRVRRVIRKIDAWTVLKVSIIFNAVIALVFVLGSVVFWSVFVNAGIPEKISELAEALTLSFSPDGPTYFRVVVLFAIVWTVFSTGFFTLGALLYNLISDIVGGVEVVVLEETLVVPTAAAPGEARTRQVRRSRPRTAPQEPAPAPARPPAERPAAERPAGERPAAVDGSAVPAGERRVRPAIHQPAKDAGESDRVSAR